MHGSPVTSPVARVLWKLKKNVEPMEQKNASGKMRRGTARKKKQPKTIKFSLTAIGNPPPLVQPSRPNDGFGQADELLSR